MTAAELRQTLRGKASVGEPIVIAGAGTGLSAKCAEMGGADAVVIYNSGRYRMAGRGSLAGLMPYGDANQVVLEMATETVPVLDGLPVIAGVCATDPFRDMSRLLDQLTSLGIMGIQNFPTVGLIDGVFRQHLEATGMSYQSEIALVEKAADKGVFTMPYVFDPTQARAMNEAGADVIVAHLGLTVGGTIGAPDTMTVRDAVATLAEIVQAVSEDSMVLCHGGPIAEPGDLQEAMDAIPRLAGFVGASSIERLPTEEAIVKRVEQFRSVRTQP